MLKQSIAGSTGNTLEPDRKNGYSLQPIALVTIPCIWEVENLHWLLRSWACHLGFIAKRKLIPSLFKYLILHLRLPPLSPSLTHTHTSLFLLFIYSLTSRLYILWLMHSQLQSSAQTPSFPPNLQLLLFAASFRALPFQPHEQVLVSEEFYQNFPLGVPLSHRVLSSHPDGWCAGRTQVKFMSLRVWKSPAPPGGLWVDPSPFAHLLLDFFPCSLALQVCLGSRSCSQTQMSVSFW